MTEIKQLQENMGYTFKDEDILKKALVHPSYLNEKRVERIYSNQRLEFFGDSVLSLAVSEYIFKNLKNYPEGKLTELRAKVVCESALAKMAKKLDVGKYLLLGRGERMSGGENRPSTLSDAMEAIIAAVYLDGGFESAREFVLANLKDEIDNLVKSGEDLENYKSQLQEYAQSKGIDITYKHLEEKGPEHSRIFSVCVVTQGKSYPVGEGTSKKRAEQEAARLAYKELKK